MIKGHLFKNYLGLPGAGKTLSAVEEDILFRYLLGQKIVSNSWFNLKGVHYFSDIEEVVDLRNCVLFIDEIGQYIDPYAWATVSQAVRRFFSYHRKKHVDIISTSQDISQIFKGCRILITEHIFCEDNNYSPFFAKILSWFNYGSVRINQRSLSVVELLKLQKGVGSSPLIDDEELEDKDEFSEDLNLDDVELENPVIHKTYSYKRLNHFELDDFKIELVHRYCSMCCQRQGDQILKEDTDQYCFKDKKGVYHLKTVEYCPNHPNHELHLRYSGIYDTDFDLPVADVDIEWRPFVKSPLGYTKIPFKGGLSPSMLNKRSNLSSSL